jgi:hypothetical protein
MRPGGCSSGYVQRKPDLLLYESLFCYGMIRQTAPHVGLAVAMVWMSFLISERVRGRPGCLGWDNFHQYRRNRSRCQEVTVSGCTNINADFQSCQIM